MKAFELAIHYMFGKPVQPVASEELATNQALTLTRWQDSVHHRCWRNEVKM
jgi:hypothetical protein